MAFLLPGIALMLWFSPVQPGHAPRITLGLPTPFARALVFALLTSAVLAGEYRVFVTPNSPTVLHTSWSRKNLRYVNFSQLVATESYRFIGELPLNHRLQRQTIRFAAVGGVVLVALFLGWPRFRRGRRKWFQVQIVCLLPCLILFVSDWLDIYPLTERTSQFALPCLITLLITGLELSSVFVLGVLKRRRYWVRPFVDVMVLGAIVLTLIAGRSKN